MLPLVLIQMRIMQIITALMLLAAVPHVHAQSQSTFKRTTATILFASIGGGILGLSTLSFYGKPQEHTDNITTGVLVGFLAGASYVMYDNYQQQSAINDLKPLPNYAVNQVSTDTQSGQKKRGPELNWPLFSFNYNW